MTKNEFIEKRTQIISQMLDNPDKNGLYPTTECFSKLDDLFDGITECKTLSWAQKHTVRALKL